MVKEILLRALVAAACAISSIPATADDQADIKQMYSKLNAAMKAKDVDKVLALTTPDFKESKINGKVVPAKEAAQAMRARFSATTRVDDATIKPDSITVTGDKAVVWTSYTMKAQLVDKEGKMGPKGAKHEMADAGKTRDILVRTPKGWRFSETKTLKQAPTMDGKSTYRMGGGRPRR
jgi:ketosteroid isomerase-like protein